MTMRSAVARGAIAIGILALVLRTVWILSDPPAHTPIGIVWHDEGAWVHNARNRALWGAWRTDAWNPVFVAPVFTALEFAAFDLFGVGTWQARTVPIASGLAAIVMLMMGLGAVAGPRAALTGGLLLATNYVFVMWNRAALLESTMVGFMVASWALYALSERRPALAAGAGAAAGLAWFSKASAACFVAALGVEAVTSWWLARRQSPDGRRHAAVAMAWIVLGASAVLAAALLVLLLPYWAEYRFYNWEMSVLRKPAYTVRALVDRVSWLPLVQGTFARMWPVLVAAALGCVAVVLRWREARPAERLLVWWLVIGLAELAVHDSGNERRYLMFVPLMIALGTIFLTTRPSAPAAATQTSTGWPERVAALGLTAALAYLVAGSGMRLLLAERVTGGDLSLSVRVAAAASISLAIAAAWRWRTVVWALRARARPSALLPALALLGIAWNVPDYLDWMAHRGSVNYDASVAVGRLLPPGTLVQGKLANGLALENTIRPLFVGNGFGNYADRFVRDDAGYILTYDLPRIGFESSDGSELIQQILDRYPRRTVVAAFPVDETPEPERAVLIDKMPDR